MPTLSARQVFANPVHLLACGFGAGLVPKGPGTAGTLVAIPIYIVMMRLDPWTYLAVTAVMFVAGIFICGYTARRLQVDDPGMVVWDEIVGYLISMAWVPFGGTWMAAGFLLFRLLDIWKPWPIRYFDRNIKGGFGIMLDDLVAAIPVCAVLGIAAHFLGV
jgi:phosphatidylglycerophosphatase A